MCLIKKSVHCLTNKLLIEIDEEDDAITAAAFVLLDTCMGAELTVRD